MQRDPERRAGDARGVWTRERAPSRASHQYAAIYAEASSSPKVYSVKNGATSRRGCILQAYRIKTLDQLKASYT
jgi:hypothetical protein